jgi:hypothetical protein
MVWQRPARQRVDGGEDGDEGKLHRDRGWVTWGEDDFVLQSLELWVAFILLWS